MPVYESCCPDTECKSRGRRVEWYAAKSTSPDPSCQECGHLMQRLVSSFGVIWSRPFSYYNDKAKDNSQMDEHTVWRKRSTRRADGKPEICTISTFKEQADYCREEKLVNPRDLPSNAEPSRDGMKLTSAGMPGCEI